MLSDAERRRLTEIELALRSQDPRFVDRFGAVTRNVTDGQAPERTATRGWLIAAGLIMAFAVLMASPAMVLVASCAAVVGAGLWLTDPKRFQHGGRPPQR
jgi:hypothetical protein